MGYFLGDSYGRGYCGWCHHRGGGLGCHRKENLTSHGEPGSKQHPWPLLYQPPLLGSALIAFSDICDTEAYMKWTLPFPSCVWSWWFITAMETLTSRQCCIIPQRSFVFLCLRNPLKGCCVYISIDITSMRWKSKSTWIKHMWELFWSTQQRKGRYRH